MTVALSEVQDGQALAHKHLISESTWDMLVDFIVKNDEVDRTLAERIMNEALGFLKLIAVSPGRTFCPSKTVDIGWHAFLMHTREYTELCERLNGRFIHHAPTEVSIVVKRTGGVVETVRSMKAAGLAVDEMLWTSTADCDANGTCGGDGDGPC